MIVGVDVSSHRIDLAYLDAEGKPQRWHQLLSGGKHDNELIDRLRRIRIQWPYELTHVAIEYPWARGNGVPALWAVMGVVTRQVPKGVEVGWPEPRELRAAIGAKNTKLDAHAAVWELLATWNAKGTWRENPDLDKWDEHELDALTACIGWQKILEGQGEWP